MRICYYGGPGTGKSVRAAHTFAHLKKNHLDVGLVLEYAKVFLLRNKKITPDDQHHIFAEQLEAERVQLTNGVPVIVTDAPMLWNIYHAYKYGSQSLGDELAAMLKAHDDEFPCANVFLERGNYPFQQAGRYQTEADARQMDKEVLDMVTHHYGTSNLHFVKSDDEDANNALALRLAQGAA